MSREPTYASALRREARWLGTCKTVFSESGMDVAARERAIAALPVVDWKGRPLHTLRCQADFGIGPHDVNVSESLLWAIVSLDHFLCSWHR